MGLAATECLLFLDLEEVEEADDLALGFADVELFDACGNAAADKTEAAPATSTAPNRNTRVILFIAIPETLACTSP